MSTKVKINSYLKTAIRDITILKNQHYRVTHVIELLKTIRDADRQVFVCGNGGSSSTASHFVNDLRKIANIKAYCLSDNIASMTAYANDDSYASIFVDQLKVLANEKDLLVVISGSGKSPNIVNAIEWANRKGLNTVAVVGMNGGHFRKAKTATEKIYISTDMLHSEDIHMLICHLIIHLLEEERE